MWQDSNKKHYYWAAISEDFDRLLEELYEIERDESSDLFRFKLHIDSKEDMEAFDPQVKERVLEIYEVLMRDTGRHSRAIQRVCRVLSEHRKKESK